jgi:hypothetical protein
VTEEEIAAIRAGADGGSWSPLEADLLRATDQLLDDYRVDDTTWARLATQFDETALTEMLYVVGTYTLLAMVFNGLGVELDPDLDPSIAPALPDGGTS